LNNFKTDGCGLPGVSRFYFIFFQIIVGQVFLNLFIAIVVDTFIEMKQAHDLPIQQRDVDIFVEMWQKYDPEGIGYIEWRKLEDLLLDLVENDTSFFERD